VKVSEKRIRGGIRCHGTLGYEKRGRVGCFAGITPTNNEGEREGRCSVGTTGDSASQGWDNGGGGWRFLKVQLKEERNHPGENNRIKKVMTTDVEGGIDERGQ